MTRRSWLTHVMDALSDAHQNVVDQAFFVDSREMDEDERELLRLIDAAFLHAQRMRITDVHPSHVI